MNPELPFFSQIIIPSTRRHRNAISATIFHRSNRASKTKKTNERAKDHRQSPINHTRTPAEKKKREEEQKTNHPTNFSNPAAHTAPAAARRQRFTLQQLTTISPSAHQQPPPPPKTRASVARADNYSHARWFRGQQQQLARNQNVAATAASL